MTHVFGATFNREPTTAVFEAGRARDGGPSIEVSDVGFDVQLGIPHDQIAYRIDIAPRLDVPASGVEECPVGFAGVEE